MLIDEFLPVYDFSERHETRIRASRERVFAAVDSTDFSASWTIWGLLALRGLGWSHAAKSVTLRDMTKDGFTVLGETPNEEILLGLAGKFWTLGGSLQKVDAGNFREFDEKGFAKAVWNFSLSEKDGETLLKTETRIRCLDEGSRKSFALYWTVIEPFSGLIRTEMLRLIKEKAESGS
ncbi:MAG TPA: hypothetical protein VNB22_01500 [Pyrinomonadaceae bacterium]|jgi:hypothetical protein|nr:hypothetical protein [Pyrinomonadaceae bacterium]